MNGPSPPSTPPSADDTGPAVRRLALATRISLLLLVVVTFAGIALAWFNQHVILATFAETEMGLVLQNRSILERTIATEVNHLKVVVTDWAQWDDLYAFTEGETPESGTAVFDDAVLDRLELDVVLVIDAAGHLQYGDARSGDVLRAAGANSRMAIHLARILTGATPRFVFMPTGNSSLLPKPGSGQTLAGLLDTPEGPMVLSMRSISKSDGSGGDAGTLVMGRLLHVAPIFTPISVLPSTVIAHGGGGSALAGDMQDLARELAGKTDGYRLITRRDDMSDFRLIRDLAGDPTLILEIRMLRSVVAAGREATRLLLFSLVATGAVAILVVISLVNRIVSRPLRRLTGHMLALRESSGRLPTPGQDRSDEIGVLARRFEELEAARYADGTRLRLLAAAVEHAGDAIAIMDAHGTISYVNPQYERQTGVKGADVIGRSPSRGLSARATYDELWATVRAGQNWSGLLQSSTRDGSIHHEQVTVAPIRNADGQITNFIAVMHDVTERLKLQEQLTQARKLEAVGQLAAGVAHEINTPTQYVGGNIRFLQEAFGNVTDLLAELVRLASLAGDDAVPVADINQALVNADVDFLQAEVPVALRQSLEGVERVAEIVQSMSTPGDPARNLEPSDINAVIESAVRIARNEWQGVAEVSTDLDPGLPRVPCQAGGINQVIVNMLVNAAHAMQGSSSQRSGQPGRITVATRRVDDTAEIRISDNGSGMSADVCTRVFDPFFTTKEVGQGTGQGLTIAHNVVKKHNGSITVESAPGQGSCFTIRLPLAEEPVTSRGGGRAAAA